MLRERVSATPLDKLQFGYDTMDYGRLRIAHHGRTKKHSLEKTVLCKALFFFFTRLNCDPKYFHKNGKCRYGERCTYIHEPDLSNFGSAFGDNKSVVSLVTNRLEVFELLSEGKSVSDPRASRDGNNS